MSAFYDRMAELVVRLIDKYGVTVQCGHTDIDTNAYTRENIRCIFVDPKKYVIPDAQLDPEDRRIVADARFPIYVDDRIDNRYIVMRVRPIQPADVLLGYSVDLRYG